MDVIEISEDGSFSLPEAQPVLPVCHFEVIPYSKPSALRKSQVDLLEIRLRVPEGEEVVESGLKGDGFVFRTQSKEVLLPLNGFSVDARKVEAYREDNLYTYRLHKG